VLLQSGAMGLNSGPSYLLFFPGNASDPPPMAATEGHIQVSWPNCRFVSAYDCAFDVFFACRLEMRVAASRQNVWGNPNVDPPSPADSADEMSIPMGPSDGRSQQVEAQEKSPLPTMTPSSLIPSLETLYRGHGSRGPPTDFISLIDQKTRVFTCKDRSQTILLSWVNDDYCDCGDGSDEMGTSACKNNHFLCGRITGDATAAAPRLRAKAHPRNEEALSIPSSKVNDGFCDW